MKSKLSLGARLKAEILSWFFRPLFLSKPIGCYWVKGSKSSLIGHFFVFFPWWGIRQVRSPFSAEVNQIYLDSLTISLRNAKGLQIILKVELTVRPSPTVIRCLAKEKKKVSEGSLLWLVKPPWQIKKVIVIIPWQPWILVKISDVFFWGRKSFASLHYRDSPWSATKLSKLPYY